MPEGTMVRVRSLLIFLAVAAFLSRVYPLHLSPYPFNNDSLAVCGISTEILDSSHLTYSHSAPWSNTHSVNTPFFSILIAFVAGAIGVTPLQCAQFVTACISVLTACCFFLLGRKISNSILGGFAAGLGAVLMGTFVFTTGSAWNEALGMALLVLAVYAFVHRVELRFRILTFVLLMTLPLVHHLVAATAFFALSYLLVWSWYFALSKGVARKRHLDDLFIIAIPIIFTAAYYGLVSFDRLSMLSSPVKLLLLFLSFVLMSLVSIWILMLRSHSKWTFSPVVGVGLVILLLLDYSGLVFPYRPSVSELYVLLIFVSGYLFAIAWYGTEMILEARPLFRAVQLALLMSPLTIVGYGLLGGLSTVSHQVVYRSFDQLDPFIFLGLSAALVFIRGRHKRVYPAIGMLVVMSLALSFPFAYESAQLLGVRHDTQHYEIDALGWAKTRIDTTGVITDERLGYVSRSVFWLTKDASLPGYMLKQNWIAPGWICMSESSWTTSGVNFYPKGTVRIPISNYTQTTDAADLVYLGGPVADQAVIFIGSEMGQSIIYRTLQ